MIVVNPFVIQLAATLEDSQIYTFSCGSGCTQTHNPVAVPISAPSKAGATQEIVPAPVANLTNGFTYTIDSASSGSSIELDPAGGTSAIPISTQESWSDHGTGGTVTVIGGDFLGGQTCPAPGSR